MIDTKTEPRAIWRGRLPALFLIMLVSILGLTYYREIRISSGSGNDAISGNANKPVETVIVEAIHSGTIARNSSLYAELLNLELSHPLVAELTSRFSRLFDLTRSQPGDRFKLFMGPGEKVVAFEYTTGDWRRFRLDRDGDRFIETIDKIGLECEVVTVTGEVESTLWDALMPELPDMEVFFDMVDIFGWEIDFLTDPKIGDKYKIAFEVYSNDGKFVKTGNILAAEYILDGTPYRAFLFVDPEGHQDYFDEYGYSLRRTLLKSPLNFRRISSSFSYNRLHPIHKIPRPHLGVDYAAAVGTPVVAAGDGYVAFKGTARGFGNYLEINHSHDMVTCYGHLSGFARGVAQGRHVVQGQVIGYVGNTGESTGPHLDYRVRKNGKYVNPFEMTVPAAMPVKDTYRNQFLMAVVEQMQRLEDRKPSALLARLD